MKNEEKLDFFDYIFMSIILFSEAGDFDIFPIYLSQIITVGFLILLICNAIIFKRKECLKIKSINIVLFIYIFIITITHYFDEQSIRRLIYFFMGFSAVYIYYKSRRLVVIYKVLYIMAVVFAIYGVIQEVAYVFNLQYVYDLSWTGWVQRISENGWLIRVTAFCSEPAHLTMILPIGFIAGILLKKYIYMCNNLGLSIIIICAVLSQSSLVYFSFMMIGFTYLWIGQASRKKKLVLVIMTILGVLLLGVYFQEQSDAIITKLILAQNTDGVSNNELTSFAIWSNLFVAIEKIKDGYWLGTGFESHRFYYDEYMKYLYSYVFMELNSTDAASMYTRILSEFGIVGLSIFLGYMIMMIRKYYKCGNFDMVVWCTVFLSIIIRNGHYTVPTHILLLIMILNINYRKLSQFKNNMKKYK